MSAVWGHWFGVFCAAVVVLRVAVWARYPQPVPRPAPVRGRHRRRPRWVLPTDVLDVTPAGGGGGGRHLAAVPDTPADEPLPYLAPEDYEYDIDDWTADLPTAEIPVVVAAPPVERVHTSPSAEACRRWQVECPIFAGLAEELGYGERGFEGRAAA